MKILAITNTKGSVHTSRPEVEQFVELFEMGIDIDICTQPDTEYAEILRKKGIIVLDGFPSTKKDKQSVQKIRSYILENKYDIVHVLNRKTIIAGLRATKGLSTKVVAYRGASGIYWHDPTAYENVLNSRISKVICVCNDIRDNLRKQLFFKKEKAVTIYKGHRMSWYDDVEPISRQELGVAEDDLLIACSANNRSWKGIPELLDAVDLLPRDLKLKILLVGDGMDTKYYRDKIARNCNRGNIIVLGFRDDALSISKTADVIMQTSLKNEGLSRSTIEGMAMCCAPIVTNAGGNDELVQDGKCGLVVPTKDIHAMADAIMKLYNSPETLHRLQQEAHKRIKNDFTVRKTAQETIEVYKEVLNH